MIEIIFSDLTPNGTDTEELLADAYAAKQNRCDADNDDDGDGDDDDTTRVDEGPMDDMDGMTEQTLTEGELSGSDGDDSLEGATLTPTKSHEQQPTTNERENLVSLIFDIFNLLTTRIDTVFGHFI